MVELEKRRITMTQKERLKKLDERMDALNKQIDKDTEIIKQNEIEERRIEEAIRRGDLEAILEIEKEK